MSNKQFNWDKYFGEASFKDVRAQSADPSAKLPSTYSPDRKFLLLSSLDIVVQTDAPRQLKEALANIKNSYAMANRAGRVGHRQAYAAYTDCIAVCGLLIDCTDDPSEYADPDGLLESVTT